MVTVKISPKYQVVIPQKMRKLLGLTPGQKMQVITYHNQIIFIPVRQIHEARGFLKGMNTDLQREDDRI